MRLKEKVAIITGAGAGIGESATRLFAAEGATVVAVDLNRTKIEALAESMQEKGLQCHPLAADVSRAADCRQIVESTIAQFGGLDVLFNNAGIVHQGTLVEASEEDWDQSMEVNVKSMFRLCKLAIPHLIQRPASSIINMASVAGFYGVAKRGVYSVSKAAVVGLTKSLAMDYVKDGLRVNCICPATVDTPSLRERINSAPDPVRAEADFLARQPMGRIGKPEEIAAMALYLAADESAYMTGQALVIDGGMKV